MLLNVMICGGYLVLVCLITLCHLDDSSFAKKEVALKKPDDNQYMFVIKFIIYNMIAPHKRESQN